MNLAELRTLVRVLVGDPHEDAFAGDVRLDDAINGAYEDISLEIALQGKSTNVHGTPISVSVTSAAREYPLTPPEGVREIRRVIDVVRTDGSYNPTPLTIENFGQRDATPLGLSVDWLRLYGEGQSNLYVYRNGSTGLWTVGFYDREPVTQTLAVTFEPAAPVLVQAGDVPLQVPAEFHRTLAYRAGVLLLAGEEDEDPRGLATLYAEGLGRLMRLLGKPVGPSRCRMRR